MMSNEEAAAHFIGLIGQKMIVLLDNVDIADEDFVDTLEMLDDDLSNLISEITHLKAAASEIMMLEAIFDKS